MSTGSKPARGRKGCGTPGAAGRVIAATWGACEECAHRYGSPGCHEIRADLEAVVVHEGRVVV